MEGKKSIEGKVSVNESNMNIANNILETTSKFNILVEKFRRLNIIKNKNGLSYEEFNKLIFDDKTVNIFTEICLSFILIFSIEVSQGKIFTGSWKASHSLSHNFIVLLALISIIKPLFLRLLWSFRNTLPAHWTKF